MRNEIRRCIPISWKLLLKYYQQSYKNINATVGKYIFLDFGNYCNAGDQAIGISMLDFLRKNVSDDVTYFNVSDFYTNIKAYKKIIKSDTIIILSGGGNIGTTYLYYEHIREMVCFLFKHNKIIVFPQTVDFRDLSIRANRVALKNAKKIYARCDDLTICARERYSFKFMQKHFKNNKVLLVPDIVLRYKPDIQECEIEKRALFCFRDDKEKAISENLVNQIKQYFLEKEYQIEDMDTCDSGIAMNTEKECVNYVNQKLIKISKAEVIFTDRLHGMVFCYITHRPCIVFSNHNHKVKGLYEWIKDSGNVFYVENFKDAISCWEKIRSNKASKYARIDDEKYKSLVNACKG